MKSILRTVLMIGTTACLPAWIYAAHTALQDAGKQQIAIDPKTGRAVGAREISPDDLRKLIEKNTKTIIIDVRDDAQFGQETIPGAIHIPFADLKTRLKEIPRDRTLVFT